MQEKEENCNANQNQMPEAIPGYLQEDPIAVKQASQQLEEPMILEDEDVPMIHKEDHIHTHDDIACAKLSKIFDDMRAPLYAYDAITN